MAATALPQEERIGLGLAVAAHIALVAFLVWRPVGDPVVVPPERMTVTFSEDVGVTSTSPEPAAQAAPDVAPTLGDPAPAVPAQEPQPVPQPEPAPPQPRAHPAPPPRPAARAAPAPREQPRPQPKAVPKPQPKAAPDPVRQQPAPRAAAPKATPPAAPKAAAPKATTANPRQAGGSRIGDDFLKGVQGAQNTGASTNPPAETIGPAVQASLRSAVSRQLKPHWTAPQGADAELLVTLVRFRLARDGSLAGQPEVVGQSGVTAANTAQKARHAEQAIRAIRLAAPFDLPDEYYSAWQTVTSRFDRRLSQ
jgi:outer membrane biosynthesis protein TonB